MDEDVKTTAVTMSRADFLRLRDFIYNGYGIKITDVKKSMLETRLQKRLRGLNLRSFSEYCDYLFSPQGIKEEVTQMINQVTTNKTDFFREPEHFNYLVRKAVPELSRTKKTISIWSAGCSTGEEPYTLAMVMAEYAGANDVDYRILATDISTKVLEKAKIAVYEEERVDPIETSLKNRYLLRNKDRTKKVYRVVPELRQRVKFRQLNFMDEDFGFRERMDVIFCRNVIIYFDKATQERLLNRFCRYLSPNGYIFMGHSETILGMNVPLVAVAPTIYRQRH